MDLLRDKLKIIYEEFQVQLFTVALSITGNRETAEDAVHNTFFKLLNRGYLPYDLKLYIFKSIRNSAIDQVRKKKKNISLNEEYDNIFDSSNGFEENIEEKQFKTEIAAALLKLSANERETIIQHLYADLTFKEISIILEAPIGTVTSWYRRGINKLKENVKEYDDG